MVSLRRSHEGLFGESVYPCDERQVLMPSVTVSVALRYFGRTGMALPSAGITVPRRIVSSICRASMNAATVMGPRIFPIGGTDDSGDRYSMVMVYRLTGAQEETSSTQSIPAPMPSEKKRCIMVSPCSRYIPDKKMYVSIAPVSTGNGQIARRVAGIPFVLCHCLRPHKDATVRRGRVLEWVTEGYW